MDAPNVFFRRPAASEYEIARRWIGDTRYLRRVNVANLANLLLFRRSTLRDIDDAWLLFRDAVSDLHTAALTISGAKLSTAAHELCQRVRTGLREMLHAIDDKERARHSNEAANAASELAWQLESTGNPACAFAKATFEDFDRWRQAIGTMSNSGRTPTIVWKMLHSAGYDCRQILVQARAGCIAANFWVRGAPMSTDDFEQRMLVEASERDIRHILSICDECYVPAVSIGATERWQAVEFVERCLDGPGSAFGGREDD